MSKKSSQRQPSSPASIQPTKQATGLADADLSQSLNERNARRETTGCPTGLADPEQAQAPQMPGGGGAPGTGAVDPSAPISQGEGISEAQSERAEHSS